MIDMLVMIRLLLLLVPLTKGVIDMLVMIRLLLLLVPLTKGEVTT